MNDKNTTPDDDVEWVYFSSGSDEPLLERRAFVFCAVIAAIAVAAWILIGILST